MTDGPAESEALPPHEGADLAMSDAPRGLEEARVFSRVARMMLGEDTPLPQIGRFEVRGRIGSGAMGEVYLAHDPQRDAEVAVKVLAMHREADLSSAQRLQREARALSKLQHPNVVQIHEVGEHDGRLYIAMERLHGESLEARLHDGPLDAALTLVIIQDVCAAMECAHAEGIIHRDLKPANIHLVAADPSSPVAATRAKVLDFGVAKGLSTATLGGTTASGTVLGTPYYMSPEQARDASKVDAQADLWAVAIIAYECLVGRRPFDATNLPDLAVQLLTEPLPTPSEQAPVPAGFDTWFKQATHRSPDKRLPTAQKLADALAAVLVDKPQPRRTLLPWLAAAAAATGLGMWLLGAPDPKAPAPRPPQPTADAPVNPPGPARPPAPAEPRPPEPQKELVTPQPGVAPPMPAVPDKQPPPRSRPASPNKSAPAATEQDVSDLAL